MCNAPVTFGGGITITYFGLLEPAAGVKNPRFSHHSYHDASTSAGAYDFASSPDVFFFTPKGVRTGGTSSDVVAAEGFTERGSFHCSVSHCHGCSACHKLAFLSADDIAAAAAALALAFSAFSAFSFAYMIFVSACIQMFCPLVPSLRASPFSPAGHP